MLILIPQHTMQECKRQIGINSILQTKSFYDYHTATSIHGLIQHVSIGSDALLLNLKVAAINPCNIPFHEFHLVLSLLLSCICLMQGGEGMGKDRFC